MLPPAGASCATTASSQAGERPPDAKLLRVRKAAITYYALGGPPLAGPDLSVAPTGFLPFGRSTFPEGRASCSRPALAVGDVAAVAPSLGFLSAQPCPLLAGTNGNDVPSGGPPRRRPVIEGNNHNSGSPA
jgi:hypothetical protein